MNKTNWIKRFEPLNRAKLIEAVLETEKWLDKYSHIKDDECFWDVMPEKESDENALLLKDTSLYGGAAGIAYFYLRLYVALKDEKWLVKAKEGINYCIRKYRGVSDFETDEPYLPGAYIGFMNGPAGGAYVASRLYEITHEDKYKDFAIRVTKDAIKSAKEENGKLTWYGFYGILGEGGLVLYLLDAYKTYGNKKFLEAAKKAVDYIADQKELAPGGGLRWYVMPTETFPTIGKAGGYFPGFEYGAAGCGYIFASLYEYIKDENYLEIAKQAAIYIQNVAIYSEDERAALVPYNDTYLKDLFYLGVCQGPIGTSRLFYKLYEITEDEKYKEFIIKLTEGLLSSGAPEIHSEGYWRTNCYCCGGAGMLEHFINVHKLTGDEKYLHAAYRAAEAVIGESTHKGEERNWYTAWNRHEPGTSDAYTGLYHGSTGCASALLLLGQFIEDREYLPPYLEDPYKDLFE